MTLSPDNLTYVTERQIFDKLYEIFLTKQKLELEDLSSEGQKTFTNLAHDIYCYVNKKS